MIWRLFLAHRKNGSMRGSDMTQDGRVKAGELASHKGFSWQMRSVSLALWGDRSRRMRISGGPWKYETFWVKHEPCLPLILHHCPILGVPISAHPGASRTPTVMSIVGRADSFSPRIPVLPASQDLPNLHHFFRRGFNRHQCFFGIMVLLLPMATRI